MTYDDLFWPLPALDRSTNTANSVTHNNRVIIKMMVGRDYLQFNVGSQSWWGSSIPCFPILLPLAQVKTSIFVPWSHEQLFSLMILQQNHFFLFSPIPPARPCQSHLKFNRVLFLEKFCLSCTWQKFVEFEMRTCVS